MPQRNIRSNVLLSIEFEYQLMYRSKLPPILHLQQFSTSIRCSPEAMTCSESSHCPDAQQGADAYLEASGGLVGEMRALILARKGPFSPGQSHLNFQAACRAHLYSRALKIGLL